MHGLKKRKHMVFLTMHSVGPGCSYLLREGQLKSTDSDYARAANVSLHVANTSYTVAVRPDKLFADLAYRNIGESLSGDPELAIMMGLGIDPKTVKPSIDDVLVALSHNDQVEAMRCFSCSDPDSHLEARTIHWTPRPGTGLERLK